MNWKEFLYHDNERPLEHLVTGISYTAIFRRMAFIGDSLSSGEFESVDENGVHSYHDMFEYSWGQYIARQYGITAYNFSRGGMSAREYMEYFAEEKGLWDPAFACQAYVIALGVNDLTGQGQTVGTAADIDLSNYHNNNKTFMGYCGQIISRYKEIQPEALFFLITMPRSGDIHQDIYAQNQCEAMYTLATLFSNVFVVDLFQHGPVYDEKFKENYWLHGHLNPSGYILTARMVDSYIDYIIRHNSDAFRKVSFIGTGL